MSDKPLAYGEPPRQQQQPQQQQGQQGPPGQSAFANIVPNRNSNIVFNSGPHANGGAADRMGHATVQDGVQPPVMPGGKPNRGGHFQGNLHYGHGDLAPAGSVPFGQGGGMMVGPNHPDVRDRFAGRGGRGHGGEGGHDFGAEYGRYLPVMPGEDPRGRGRGRGGMGFGGPDPDHMPPFDPRGAGPGAFQHPCGRGGMPGNNNLGGPGCY